MNIMKNKKRKKMNRLLDDGIMLFITIFPKKIQCDDFLFSPKFDAIF